MMIASAIFSRAFTIRLFVARSSSPAQQTHAYCLMTNHFHLVLETPQPNLALGMRSFLGTYTQRFNRHHQQWGHLFGGRYKAQLIDGRSPGYLRRACDYTHLNPVRARLVGVQNKLESYRWSSYPAYRRPKLRPDWMRFDRLLGEHGLIEDTIESRRELDESVNQSRAAPAAAKFALRAWKIRAEDFHDWLTTKLGRRGRKGEQARERSETDGALAERLLDKALLSVGWDEADLATQLKSHPLKVEIARQLRTHTPMTHQWIADRLRMGSASHVSNLLSTFKS